MSNQITSNTSTDTRCHPTDHEGSRKFCEANARIGAITTPLRMRDFNTPSPSTPLPPAPAKARRPWLQLVPPPPGILFADLARMHREQVHQEPRFVSARVIAKVLLRGRIGTAGEAVRHQHV
jgi:hypothetical protein